MMTLALDDVRVRRRRDADESARVRRYIRLREASVSGGKRQVASLTGGRTTSSLASVRARRGLVEAPSGGVDVELDVLDLDVG